MSYKEKINLRIKSKLADKLSLELRKLIIICQKNLHHAYQLQKRAHNKNIKPKSYISSKNVWLNNKYIKIK